MPYSYIAPRGLTRAGLSAPLIASTFCSALAGSEADPRWPALLRAMRSLRKRGRRSLRIVDAACGTGDLLMNAVRRTRLLGFTAIEAKGVDTDPSMIATAGLAAGLMTDPAIGLDFETGSVCDALAAEAEFPADVVLYVEDGRANLRASADAAGAVVLCTRDAEPRERAA